MIHLGFPLHKWLMIYRKVSSISSTKTQHLINTLRKKFGKSGISLIATKLLLINKMIQ